MYMHVIQYINSEVKFENNLLDRSLDIAQVPPSPVGVAYLYGISIQRFEMCIAVAYFTRRE